MLLPSASMNDNAVPPANSRSPAPDLHVAAFSITRDRPYHQPRHLTNNIPHHNRRPTCVHDVFATRSFRSPPVSFPVFASITHPNAGIKSPHQAKEDIDARRRRPRHVRGRLVNFPWLVWGIHPQRGPTSVVGATCRQCHGHVSRAVPEVY